MVGRGDVRPLPVIFALLVLTSTGAAQPKAAGTIAGTVSWKGAAPARAPLDRKTDPVCAKTARLNEDIVVTDGKLRDVHVRLKLGSAGTHAAPGTAAVMAQTECMYSPRVLGVVAGQKVEILNGDPTFHNVRGNLGTKILFNLPHMAGGAPLSRGDLGKAGDVVAMRCDVHPWMAAWIVIRDHSYFAVTGDDGAFTLANVPPGSYTLEAWHPTLGLKTAKVKVKKGKTAKASFSFAAPSS